MSLDQIREYLAYDPATGVFTWLKRPGRGSHIKPGNVAGGVDTHGHCRIRFKGKWYAAHRLAWFFVHGEMPPSEIDHRNMVKDDNRIENLRLATRRQNKTNVSVRPDNASGFKGVNFIGRLGKWRARIKIDGKEVSLGCFSNAEAAARAYDKAANDRFGEFARLNFPERATV